MLALYIECNGACRTLLS